MKISIITAVRDNRLFFEDCVRSVLAQTYKNIEYIVIDGASTDGTLEIANRYKEKISKIVSEKDRGVFDALNKGIGLATGEIVGILHSDDLFEDADVIGKVIEAFGQSRADSVYGDLVYVDKNDVNKIVRYWKAGEYNRENFKNGWMAPHPAFFVKHEIYQKHGGFNTSFKIAADYELMVRFLYRNGVSAYHIPKTLVRMRIGGISNSIPNMFKKSREDYRALRINGVDDGLAVVLRKNISKIPQFFKRA